MRRRTTVGIDDDFTTGQTAIALWAANHKSASRVDQELNVALNQFFRQGRLDDFFYHRFAYVF